MGLIVMPVFSEQYKELRSISKAKTYEEMAEFWDTHSLADYDEQTYAVEMIFDPAARRTYARGNGPKIPPRR